MGPTAPVFGDLNKKPGHNLNEADGLGRREEKGVSNISLIIVVNLFSDWIYFLAFYYVIISEV